jgi:hypothetical protein
LEYKINRKSSKLLLSTFPLNLINNIKLITQLNEAPSLLQPTPYLSPLSILLIRLNLLKPNLN